MPYDTSVIIYSHTTYRLIVLFFCTLGTALALQVNVCQLCKHTMYRTAYIYLMSIVYIDCICVIIFISVYLMGSLEKIISC